MALSSAFDYCYANINTLKWMWLDIVCFHNCLALLISFHFFYHIKVLLHFVALIQKYFIIVGLEIQDVYLKYGGSKS